MAKCKRSYSGLSRMHQTYSFDRALKEIDISNLQAAVPFPRMETIVSNFFNLSKNSSNISAQFRLDV